MLVLVGVCTDPRVVDRRPPLTLIFADRRRVWTIFSRFGSVFGVGRSGTASGSLLGGFWAPLFGPFGTTFCSRHHFLVDFPAKIREMEAHSAEHSTECLETPIFLACWSLWHHFLRSAPLFARFSCTKYCTKPCSPFLRSRLPPCSAAVRAQHLESATLLVSARRVEGQSSDRIRNVLGLPGRTT
jgi:hypothetical protein